MDIRRRRYSVGRRERRRRRRADQRGETFFTPMSGRDRDRDERQGVALNRDGWRCGRRAGCARARTWCQQCLVASPLGTRRRRRLPSRIQLRRLFGARSASCTRARASKRKRLTRANLGAILSLAGRGASSARVERLSRVQALVASGALHTSRDVREGREVVRNGHGV